MEQAKVMELVESLPLKEWSPYLLEGWKVYCMYCDEFDELVVYLFKEVT